MKNKKILSILLASAMIGTAPASAWAADFADADISMEENAEDVTEEDVPEQQEDDAAEEETESVDLEEEAADLEQSADTSTEESEDPFSAGEAATAFDDGSETAGDLALKGSGTEADPYQIATTDDIQAVADYVNSGKGTFLNQYLKFTEDITLPTGWTPIGAENSKFQGNLDGGNHLLTVPEGEQCLLGYVAEASLKNLNIYGKQIASEGVVSHYVQDRNSPNPISIDNVTLKSGTQTLKSGFIGGYASGQNVITITNCTVEKGVVIGYDKQQDNIGSFGGDYNGTISNCVSYADVYGAKYVGGICGNKGQSMGTYALTDCKFYGTVTASGNYAGGISGGGYGGTQWGESTAPNTAGVTIKNCYSNGTIVGNDYVGGILGSETGMVQCWDNGIEYIQNNRFVGTVEATEGTYAGAIVGYINGLDKYNIIENNEYSGDVKGIGFIKYIDTNYENPTAVEGVTYYNTENGKPENAPSGATKTQLNRTDDPLGADADKLARKLSKIKVSLTILGDQVHDSDKDHNYHTYYAGNLQTWLEQSEYTVVEGSTAKDVIDAALLANNMTCVNPSGNYIESITKDGVTLGQFTNGKNSGWMYNLNGVMPDLGVAEQTVNNDDQIVLFYTDWYGEEGTHEWKTEWSYDENAHWHECSGQWCNISSNDRKNGYGAHTFGEGTVTKEPTNTEAGVRTYKCTVCGYEKNEEIPALAAITLNSTAATVVAGQSTTAVQLKSATVKGDKIKAAHSNNTKIAAAYVKDGKLTIKGLAAGTTTVTVASVKGAKATVKVTVVKPSVTLSSKAVTIVAGQSTTAVKIKSVNVKGDQIKAASSSNKKVTAASVKNGKLTIKGLAAGTSTVTVATVKGARTTVKVTVVKPAITLNTKAVTVAVKKTNTAVKIKSANVKGDQIKSAKSSNTKIASVSVKNGKLTIKGLKKGKVTVTVTSTKGATAKVTVTVK